MIALILSKIYVTHFFKPIFKLKHLSIPNKIMTKILSVTHEHKQTFGIITLPKSDSVMYY